MILEFEGYTHQIFLGTKDQIWTEEYQEFLYEETLKSWRKFHNSKE